MAPRKLWDIDDPPVVLRFGPDRRTDPLAAALSERTDSRIEDRFPELLWRRAAGERGYSYQLDGVDEDVSLQRLDP